MSKYCAIVVGVSAGGLEALTTIIPALPKDFSLPILIVQHRSADGSVFLEQHLNELSQVTVCEAISKTTIKPGTVYIAPADYHLLIERDKTIALSADERVNFSRPSIDVLFECAADVYTNSLIGIILTGANSDGSLGLKKIRKYGGFGIVQDPQTADTNIMPQNALDIAGADAVIPLSKIADILMELQNA